MTRKKTNWEIGSRVIFDDMGNWGNGVIETEGERGDTSRWFEVRVEQTFGDGPHKPRRLLRADDLCSYSEKKWALITDSLKRLRELDQERRALKFQITEAFNVEFDDEEFKL
jgi:hypothetical protein